MVDACRKPARRSLRRQRRCPWAAARGSCGAATAVSDGGAGDWRIGWRFDPAAQDDVGFEVNLDAMRRVAANDGTSQHGVMLSGAARW